MDPRERIQLNDGQTMPSLGYGTWQIGEREVEGLVRFALDTGYRSIDTAAFYGNEGGVGRGISASGLPRDEIFLTTKLWNEDHGFDEALRAFDKSLSLLGLDYADLYLIHWPAPALGRYAEAWRALVRLRDEGRARSIGVSNFQQEHLQRIIDESGVVPAVNQIELHPFLQQRELRVFHEKHGIVTEAWSPLAKGRDIFQNLVLTGVAQKHGKTVAQVVLRWHLQSGLVAIPKSVTPSRIQENIQLFDFQLDDEDMARIAALDEGRRVGPHPDAMS